MSQYNILNVKLSNSQLNKLKSGIKNDTQVTLNLSSGDSNDETNFPHKLLLTNIQFVRSCKASANTNYQNPKYLRWCSWVDLVFIYLIDTI